MTNSNPKRSFGASIKAMFGRRFRAGSYSAFAAIIVIAIAVAANMVVGALPAATTQLDMTAQSLYSLSDQTERIAASLDKDVSLYLLATSGSEDETVVKLLERYEGLNTHISVEQVDPNAQPTFLNDRDLGATRIYNNSVLVECGERSRLVSYGSIYVTAYSQNYSTGETVTSTRFNGEDALTNAIHYVSSDNLPKVYTLTGHGEVELSSTVTEMMTQDNLDVDSLSLLSVDAIPEDASAIIINAPTSDLNESEAEMLIEWLNDGGSIALLTDYFELDTMSNLLRVTEALGLTAREGLVIEGDSSMYLSQYPYYLLPTIETHEITEPLLESSHYILVPLAQGVAMTEEAEAAANSEDAEGPEVTYLLSTSSSAYSKTGDLSSIEKEEGDAEGTFYLAAASELDDARMCWFGASSLLNESIDQTVGGSNSDLFMNAVNWLCDQKETISIRSKSLETSGLTLTSAEMTTWSLILVGLIPLAFIAVGVTIIVRRKRR